jgi:hypothetical protein
VSDWGETSTAGNAISDATAIAIGKEMEAGAIVPGQTATESGVPILSVAGPLSIAISLKRIADALDSGAGRS